MGNIVDNFLLVIRKDTEILIKQKGARERKKEKDRQRKVGMVNGYFCFRITHADIFKRPISAESRWIFFTTGWRYSNAVG